MNSGQVQNGKLSGRRGPEIGPGAVVRAGPPSPGLRERAGRVGARLAWWLGMCCCAGAVLWSGCAKGPRFNAYLPGPSRGVDLETVAMTNNIDPEWLKPPAELFTLGPGDRIEIELLGDAASRTQAVVGPDGKVYFHLLTGMDVWGLTLAQTKTRLEKGLSDFLRDQAVVTVTLRAVESKKVWLLGRLQAPGVYSMPNPMTVLEAIALAGGTISSAGGTRETASSLTGEELADLRRAFLIRKGQLMPVDFNRLLNQGDLSQNIYLHPDDFIYFPSATARQVYVLGAVGTPRAVPYSTELTLLGAISSANGTINEAYLRHIALVRGSLSQPRIAILDYKDMTTGVVPDVPLEPQDIIYVPFKPYRYLSRYADLIVKTFVGSVAINEGARAAVKQVRATGVVIPLGGTTTTTPTVTTPVR